MKLPVFNPPIFREIQGDLNSRVKQFSQFESSYRQYLFNYMNKLKTSLQTGMTGDTPFQSIVAATSITPLQQIQPVTGGTTVATINAPADINFVVLLAVDGFSTNLLGNIALAVTLAAGEGRPFYLNFITSKWYPA